MKRLWTSFLAWWRPIAAAIAHFQAQVILSVLYIGVLAPTSLLLKLFRRDPLRLRRDKRSSYWVPRADIGRMDEFLRDQ